MTILAATFGSPFAEQLAALRLRFANLIPTQAWDDLQHAAHDRAFVVAGAMKADLLADLAGAVDKAISQHRSLDQFRDEFLSIAKARGWNGWTGQGTAKSEAWRAKVIYRTNMATSYAAGRMAQLVDGKFKFWVYKHGNALEPRLQHLAWDGLALPPDHPFWQTHAPPNGWGCTCRIRGANTEAGIRRAKGDPGKVLPSGWQSPDPKTGVARGIDKGWDYATGATAIRALLPITEKLAALPSPIGAAMASSWPQPVVRAWADAFGAFVDETLTGPPRGKMMVAGFMQPRWIQALEAEGILPATAEIAVRDQDIWHTFRNAKAGTMDLGWYRDLPVHLSAADTVILDAARSDRPTLLLVYRMAGTTKLVVAVRYKLKKIGEMNIVESGRTVNDNDIKALIGAGAILISGKV